MVDEAELRAKMEEMRALIRIGRERIARHSPVWAVYLASETLRSLNDVLDDLETEMSAVTVPSGGKRVRKAV
jgi:hypothetical protein